MSDLEKALKFFSNQSNTYEIFDKYYKGEHGINYASDKFIEKYGQRFQELKANLCKAVVNAPASRLEIIAFGSDEKGKQNKSISDTAWQIWKRNLMPKKAKDIHREAFKTGDAFVVVWYDSENPNQAKIFPQDNSANCAIWKDPETDKTKMGAKAWIGDDNKMYVTLYYPDRLEKYISKHEVSEGASLTDELAFEKRVIDGEENPLHHDLGRVPMVHFSNGESLLIDVIPLNAGLNKGLADIFVGMEYNSIKQRWSAGISYPIDPETGKPLIPFEDGEQWHTTANSEGKFGEFSDTSLSEPLKVVQELKSLIAVVSGIPLHYLQLTKGDFPSGKALIKAEARLIEMVKEAQITFGDSWGQVMSLCLQIEGKGENLTIEPQWSAAAPTDQTEELENGILKKQLGWSNKKIQEDFGLDEQTINQMADEVKNQANELGAVLGAAFDRTGAELPEN